MLKEHLNGKQLCRLLIDEIIRKFNQKWEKMHYATRDGCAVNSVAMRTLCEMEPCLICISHSINNAGNLFEDDFPVATHAINVWSGLVTRSGRIRSAFKTKSGAEALRKSNVRWYSWFEVGKQLLKYLPQILEVLEDESNCSDRLRPQLLKYITDNRSELMLELAMLKEAASPMVNMCYAMESDGFTAPLVHDMWEALLNHGKIVTGRGNNVVLQVPSVLEICKSLHNNLEDVDVR